MIEDSQDIIVAAPNESDFQAVRETLSSALQAAEASGVDRRHFRTALWHAALSTLLLSAEIPLAIAFLEDQSAALKGYGTNADSPPRVFSEADAAVRAEHSFQGSETIHAFLEPLVDKIDSEGRDGLTALLGTIFNVLRDWWGPVHLRKALSDQIRSLRTGVTAPVAPAEPLWTNKRKANGDAKVEPVPSSPRIVVLYATFSAKNLRYAAGIDVVSEGGKQRETRMVTGSVISEAEAVLQMAESVLILLQALGNVHPEDSVQILSDVQDPTFSPWVPVGLSERLMGAMRDRQASWTVSREFHHKFAERARQAVDTAG